MQSRVPTLILQVGIGSVGEQNHGGLKTALLGHNVQRALPSSAEVVDSAAVLKQDPTHLHNGEEDRIGYLRTA